MKMLRKRAVKILSVFLALLLMVSGITVTTPHDAVKAAGGVVSKKDAHEDSYGREPYFEITNNHGTNFAFCVDFNAKAPKEGTAVGEPVLSNNDALRRVLYYGNKGPADLGVYTWTFTAMAASSAMGNIPMKDGVSVGDHYNLSLFPSQPVPPEEFKVYTVNTGNAGEQDLAYWRIEESKGSLAIIKKSSNEAFTSGNSCYSLAGDEFAVYTPGTNNIVGIMTTDSSGYAKLDNIKSGTYEVAETKAPKGYVRDTSRFTVTVNANTTATYTRYNEPANDPVGLLLKKVDAEGNISAGEAGTLAGAQYTFEYFDGQYTEVQLVGKTPTRTWVLESNERGEIILRTANQISGDSLYVENGMRVIPIGTLKIHENKAPSGYNIDPTVYVINITAEDFTGALIKSYQTVTSSEKVMRGGVEVEKVDSETGDKLCGAEFTIYNCNDYSVIVNSIEYAPDAAVLTLTTDENGHAASTANALPYGAYEIVETKAPEGYLIDSTSQSFEITTDGQLVSFTGDKSFKNHIIRGGVEIQKIDAETGTPQGAATLSGAEYTIYDADNKEITTFVTDENGYAATADKALIYGKYTIIETKAPTGYLIDSEPKNFEITTDGQTISFTGEKAFKDQIIRGDLKGVKIAEDMQRMGGVPFRITSLSTGESHIIVTDENGEFNTSSEWNLHSSNTNRGGEAADGVWFGDIEELNDDLGALPYDTYTIEELPCENNEYMILIEPFNITVSKAMVTIDLGTITNDYKPSPTLHTTARDSETGIQNSYADGEITIIDTVEIDNLIPGWTYDLTGIIMDKTTGESLLVNGEEITSSITFTADDYTSAIDVEYVFDGTGLEDSSLVVYEYLYRNDKLLAAHEDIEDEGQSIYIPDVRTTAKDAATQSHNAVTSAVTTIIDTVEYTNLISGKEYTVSGVLMDKETGEPLLVNGKEITSSVTFTAVKAFGTVDVRFTFDSSALAGKTMVVFEELTYEGKTVAVHMDIDDDEQTVTFEPPQMPPKTGDSTWVVFWFSTIFVSLIGIIISTYVYKKTKR